MTTKILPFIEGHWFVCNEILRLNFNAVYEILVKGLGGEVSFNDSLIPGMSVAWKKDDA